LASFPTCNFYISFFLYLFIIFCLLRSFFYLLEMVYDDEDGHPTMWPPVPCGNAEDPDGAAAARVANAPPLPAAKVTRALTLPLPSEDGGEEGDGEGGSRDGGEQQSSSSSSSSSSRYMLRSRPGPMSQNLPAKLHLLAIRS
jgi:hypothetical protein